MKHKPTPVNAKAKPVDPTFRSPQRPTPTRQRDWPFYLDREQRALLNRIRKAWGPDCIIQIYGGRLRIIAERGTREFFEVEEFLGTAACSGAARSS